MNAAGELEFSKKAYALGRDLWPGAVRIGGSDYDASITREAVQVAVDNGAGIREVEGIRVEILKSDMAVCPDAETPVKDLSDDAVYLVKKSDGHSATDAAWFLVCAKFER